MPKKSIEKDKPASLLVVFLSNLVALSIVFLIFYTLKFPSFLLLCTHSIAQNLIFSLIAIVCLHFFSSAIQTINSGLVTINGKTFFTLLGTDVLIKKYKISLVLIVTMISLIFWLGSYMFSPLPIADANIPIIRGFTISIPGMDSTTLTSGESFQIKNDGIASIKVVSEATEIECDWLSNFGSFGDNNKCEVVYIPPLDINYDTIEIQISPICQPQESHAHLLVEIVP